MARLPETGRGRRGRRGRGAHAAQTAVPQGQEAQQEVPPVPVAPAVAPQVPVGGAGASPEVLEAIRQLLVALNQNVPVPEAAPAPVQVPVPTPVPDPRAAEATQSFLRMNPPTFSGEPDPKAATAWLRRTNKIFEALNIVNSGWKVRMATYQLQGDAEEWWECIKNTTAGTWETFSQVFLDKYVPPSMKMGYRQEFMTITQGSLSVIQYEAKFSSLSTYAPEIVSTEDLKARHFERGLRIAIKHKVVALRLPTYMQVVETAITVENMLAEDKKNNEGRPQTQSGGQQAKKRKTGGGQSFSSGSRFQKGGSVTASSAPPTDSIDPSSGQCFLCGQAGHRKRECPQWSCHHCGQQGHIRKYCPQRQLTQTAQSGQQGQHVQGRQVPAQPQQQTQTRGQIQRVAGKPPAGGNQGRVYALDGPNPTVGAPVTTAVRTVIPGTDSTAGTSVIRGDLGKGLLEE